MAKKQAQFRLEEGFLADLAELAEQEGITVSEIVRNALKIYSVIYERTKDKNVKLYLESPNGDKCELVLPWL